MCTHYLRIRGKRTICTAVRTTESYRICRRIAVAGVASGGLKPRTVLVTERTIRVVCVHVVEVNLTGVVISVNARLRVAGLADLG